MKKALLSTTGLLLALLLFLAFNILAGAGLKSMRVDLTQNRLYTLSTGTLNVLSGLKDPIKLRLYFSKKLAADAGGLTAYAQRVQELLEQYIARSHGNLSLEVVDPEPYSEDEDRAAGFGLQGVPISAGGEMLYFGLVGTNSTDQEETIPFIQETKEDSLEYDVTKLVYTLANPKKRVVGLLTKLPLEGNPMARFQNPDADSQAWAISDAMRSLFDVRTVAPTAEKIDADLDVLMLVHPQGLSQSTLYAIDQYVLGGGKVLAFLDPYCESQPVPSDPSNPMAGMMANRASDLGPVLAAWGLEMPADDIAGDRDSAMRVGYNGVAVDYLLYLALRGDHGTFSKEDLTTSKLELVNMATSGVLKKKEGASTTIAPMIQTTKEAMVVPRSKIMFRADPNELLASFESGNQEMMLAARVSGPAKTAFPDGKPKVEKQTDPPEPEAPKKDEPTGDALKEAKEINVIVVADADVLADRFWTKSQNFFGQKIPITTANNADFVINALDNLSGSKDLISLRSRGRFNRPFDRVVAIRRDADKQFGEKVKSLEAKLKDADARMNELQGQKENQSSLILSPEQQKEYERFREERDKTRKELRSIKHTRDKDIDSLGTKLKFANILLIPILLVGAATGLAFGRNRRANSAKSPVGPRT